MRSLNSVARYLVQSSVRTSANLSSPNRIGATVKAIRSSRNAWAAGSRRRTSASGNGEGRAAAVARQLPLLVAQRDLPAVPRPAARLHAGLEQHELVRPGREAARAAEGVELGQDRDERVVGRLHGEVVALALRHVPEGSAAAVQLEARAAQEQRVKGGDRLLAHGRGPPQRGEPALRVVPHNACRLPERANHPQPRIGR